MLMKLMMENPSMLKEMAEKLQTGGTSSTKSRSSRSPSSPSKSAESSSRKYKSPTRNVIAHGDSIKVNVGRNSSPASRSSASRKVISTESSSSNRKVIPQTSSLSTSGDSKFSSNRRSRSRSNSRDHESSKRSIKDRLGPVNQEKSTSSSSFKQDHWNGKSKSGKAERNGRDSKRES